jgi:hypothetical protein
MSAMEIPKLDIGNADPAVGMTPDSPGWIPATSPDGKPLKPVIRCNCGQWVDIALYHVHPDGTVTPLFYHKQGSNTAVGEDTEGCNWQALLTLKDYDVGDFPAEPGRAPVP